MLWYGNVDLGRLWLLMPREYWSGGKLIHEADSITFLMPRKAGLAYSLARWIRSFGRRWVSCWFSGWGGGFRWIPKVMFYSRTIPGPRLISCLFCFFGEFLWFFFSLRWFCWWFFFFVEVVASVFEARLQEAAPTDGSLPGAAWRRFGGAGAQVAEVSSIAGGFAVYLCLMVSSAVGSGMLSCWRREPESTRPAWPRRYGGFSALNLSGMACWSS